MTSPPIIFDCKAHRRRRERAARHMAQVRPILQEAAGRLLDRLDDITHRFTHALDIGGRGVVAPALRARGIACVSADLSPAVARLSGVPAVAIDADYLPFANGSFDLVVANLSLHRVNDLPGCLIQLRHVMRPDGLLLASLPIHDTLGPLRRALADAELALAGGVSPRVEPFPELRACADLLQRAGFALPVVDAEEITLEYAEPMQVLRDLRAAGETNILTLRDRRFASPALFAQALAHLPSRLVLRMAMLTGWSPAPTQPQPLARGSAQVSLIDALGKSG